MTLKGILLTLCVVLAVAGAWLFISESNWKLFAGLVLLSMVQQHHEKRRMEEPVSAAWRGDSAGHAVTGGLSGLKQSRKTNKANFANDRKRASEAGKKGSETRWAVQVVRVTPVANSCRPTSVPCAAKRMNH